MVGNHHKLREEQDALEHLPFPFHMIQGFKASQAFHILLEIKELDILKGTRAVRTI